MVGLRGGEGGSKISKIKTSFNDKCDIKSYAAIMVTSLGGYTLVTLPRIVTPYRDSVDGTRDCVTYQRLVTR